MNRFEVSLFQSHGPCPEAQNAAKRFRTEVEIPERVRTGRGRSECGPGLDRGPGITFHPAIIGGRPGPDLPGPEPSDFGGVEP